MTVSSKGAENRDSAGHVATCAACRERVATYLDRHSYTLPDGPKMLRETLCVLQAAFNSSVHAYDYRAEGHKQRLQRLIDECDRKRPLGPDGKHGDRHTMECGCEPRYGWAACRDCAESYLCDLDVDDPWPIREAAEEAGERHRCPNGKTPFYIDLGIIA